MLNSGQLYQNIDSFRTLVGATASSSGSRREEREAGEGGGGVAGDI